jgi:hypothetical protein
MLLFNQLFIISCWIGYCLTQSNILNSGCLDGPDFWCLNGTTESICDFTNKTIGVCGYSNKRCQVKTGKNYIFYFIFLKLKFLLSKVIVFVNHLHQHNNRHSHLMEV